MVDVADALDAHDSMPFDAFTDDEEAQFMELVASEDMLDYWASRINPKVVGLEYEKRATMLCLASHGDKCGDRGRLHLLFYGDPGTAKTLITGWIVSKLGAVGASMRSSQVGLTADASGNEITLGALPKANDGIICLDELEKFDKKSLEGLLTSMEEGFFDVDVGKTHTRIDARVRCLANANDTKKLSRELWDRFDFVIEVLKPEIEFKKKIMRSRIKYWFKEKEGYDGIDMRSYLAWIKGFEPLISDATRNTWMKVMEAYIDLTDSEGSIRTEESMIRIATTLAKMHHRNAVPADMLRAIQIQHPDLNGSKLKMLRAITDEK